MLLRADSISSPRGPPPPPEINGVKRLGDPLMPPLGCNMTKCGPTNAVVMGVSVAVVDELACSMMIGGTGVEGRRGRSAKAAGLEAADDVKKMGELLLLQLLLLVVLAETEVVVVGGDPSPAPLLVVKEAHEEEDMVTAAPLLLLALALLLLLVVVVLELMVSLICSPLADCQTARSMESGVNASSLAE